MTIKLRWGLLLSGFAVSMCVVLAFANRGVADSIYWANDGSLSIGRANLDGTGVNQTFVKNAGYVNNVAVGASGIWWAKDGSVERANLNGSCPTHNFISRSYAKGYMQPSGLTLAGQYVYWSETNGNQIGRANQDGSGINYTFIADDGEPAGVTAYGQHLYWGNQNGGSGGGSLGRANLNGSGVNEAFVPFSPGGTGPETPVSLAVADQYIYWADPDANAIGRANIDGSGANNAFISGAGSPGAGDPYAVAVTGQHIYWTTSAGWIAEANLDGSGVNLQFIRVPLGPGYTLPGLAVGPTAAQGAAASAKCLPKPPAVSRCVVPKLVGKRLKAAKTALVAAHCRLGKVRTKKAAGVRGRVLSQKPRPHRKLPALGKVSVVVSRH
jgi:virginiamycin B lyase